MSDMENGIQIPWDSYTEEEIHTIVSMLYLNLGYSVETLHKSDRANEKGADVVVRKGDESIAIAVKLKPDKNDRPQLLDLARREETRKVYIYIQTPTSSFFDNMKLDAANVEFWNAKKLNDFFLDSDLRFSAILIFDKHDLTRHLEMVRFFLSKLWFSSKNLKKKKVKPLDKNSFFVLWRLKDMAVTLHNINQINRHLFEEPLFFKDKNLDKHFLRTFLDYLGFLESKSFHLFQLLAEFYTMNPDIVTNSVIEQANRSHWLWIGSYRPLNNIDNLEEALEQAIKDTDLLKRLDKDYPDLETNPEIKRIREESVRSNDVWKAMEAEIGQLMLFGDGVESFIDDIVAEYFKDYDKLNLLEQFSGEGQ